MFALCSPRTSAVSCSCGKFQEFEKIEVIMAGGEDDEEEQYALRVLDGQLRIEEAESSDSDEYEDGTAIQRPPVEGSGRPACATVSSANYKCCDPASAMSQSCVLPSCPLWSSASSQQFRGLRLAPPVENMRSAAPRLGTCCVAAAYMVSSVGLIAFNRFLMSAGRFPHATCLAMMQMICSSALGLLLLRVRPAWYPSQTDPLQKVDINLGMVLRVVPIGCCFAAQLVLSNTAFMWSSIAFLQMLKEANIVLVYAFCCLLRLEEATRQRTMLLVFIAAATMLTIHGEVNLSWLGFVLQIISMIFDSFKNAYTKWNLSWGRKLDPLTLNMLVAPLVLLSLSVLLVLAQLCPNRPTALMLPSWTEFWEVRWLLLLNGCLAFAMNALQYMFVQRTSPIIMILSSILVKDTLIVGYGAVVLNEPMGTMQIAGFLVQVAGAVAWATLPEDGRAAADSQTFVRARRSISLTSGLSPRLPASLLQVSRAMSFPGDKYASTPSSTRSLSTEAPSDGSSDGDLTGRLSRM